MDEDPLLFSITVLNTLYVFVRCGVLKPKL